ncbi:MAG: formylglycine-generating enzyme family protein [Cyanobacteria bacterium P01_E01_bin.6]
MSDPTASPEALRELITCLRRAEIDWDAENIADLVWLSRYMDGETMQRSPSSSSSSQPLRGQTDPSRPAPPLPPPPPPPSSEIGLYSGNSQSQPTKPTPDTGGIPFQVPTAPALRKTLAIGRALRPFMRKVDSYTQQVLDEDATAEQTAEQRFCMTVVRPAKERWLEVALVIEDSAASFLWRETIRDFKQVLERQGAFRSITVWHLQTSQGDIKLFATPPSDDAVQPSRSAKELIDASGRRLILLVSDCISSAWRIGTLHRSCLELWAAHGPVAIVQLLPGHLWSRTVLSAGLDVQLRAWIRGVTNQQLLFQEPPIGAEQGQSGGLKLPVITLEPNSLTQWAKMVSGWGESWAAGIWFDDGWQDLQPHQVSSAESLSSEQLVKRFTSTASALAKRLAGLMALVPVNLPIIYLLQETMLRESTPLHLAEIFMSGLIERDDEATEVDGSNRHRKPSYDFVPDVRSPLIDSVPNPLKEEVLDRVSQYIGKKLNRSIYSFTALLQLEKELGDAGGSDLLKFATVAKQVLQQMGGDYTALVDALDRPISSGSLLSSDFEMPPLRTMSFTVAQLIDADDETESQASWPSLQIDMFTVASITVDSEADDGFELFNFKIVTLSKQPQNQGLFERVFNKAVEFEWVVNERQRQARQFVEGFDSPSTPDLRSEVQLVNFLKALPADKFQQVISALGKRVLISQTRTQERLAYALVQSVQMSAYSDSGDSASRLAAFQKQLQAIIEFDSSKVFLEMVSIPGSTFTMGSPESEPGCQPWESPQHEVTVPPFFMGRYPVTQAQWRVVAGLEQVNLNLDPDPSNFKGDDRPVEKVNWYEAVEFCARLARHTGREYRLPTEAEWEYACRAGTTTPFHFGETISSELANYRGTSRYNDGPKGEYRQETTSVFHFKVANAFGLCDMHGNVWEWCQDHWHGNYDDAPNDGSAWLTDNEGAPRVRRGGSWNFIPEDCRSAYRDLNYPVNRLSNVGFRVVCSAPRTLQGADS